MKNKNHLVILFLALSATVSYAQNVGIGTNTPNAPLQLANTAGNRKIVLFETANNNHQFYGVGINTSMFRYQVDAASSSHVFFAGTSASTSTELMRIQGNGNVGIDTNNPLDRLHVNGVTRTSGINLVGNSAIETGFGLAGKEINAGKIGYALFTPNTLDIIGGGTPVIPRRIRFWAEGGSIFEGPINVSEINSYTGLTSGIINVNAFTKLGNESKSLPVKTVTLIGDIFQRNLIIGNRAEATTNIADIPLKSIISHTAIVSYSEPTVDWSFSTSGTSGGFGKFSYELRGINSVGVYAVFANCDLCGKNAKLIVHITYTDTPQW